MIDGYYTAEEFAELLGIRYETFIVWRSRGKLPDHDDKWGHRPLWLPAGAERFAEKVKADPLCVDRRPLTATKKAEARKRWRNDGEA